MHWLLLGQIIKQTLAGRGIFKLLSQSLAELRIFSSWISNHHQKNVHKNKTTNNHHNKTVWPLLNYQVPSVLANNFHTSFSSFPHALLSEKNSGKKGTLELPRFVDLDQVQHPRQTWEDWFPSAIWQCHPHSNDMMSFMPIRALWYVWLHLIFTLGVSRTSGLVLTLALEQPEHRSLTQFVLCLQRQEEKPCSLGLFLPTGTVPSDAGVICEVGLHWREYTHGNASESQS